MSLNVNSSSRQPHTGPTTTGPAQSLKPNSIVSTVASKPGALLHKVGAAPNAAPLASASLSTHIVTTPPVSQKKSVFSKIVSGIQSVFRAGNQKEKQAANAKVTLTSKQASSETAVAVTQPIMASSSNPVQPAQPFSPNTPKPAPVPKMTLAACNPGPKATDASLITQLAKLSLASSSGTSAAAPTQQSLSMSVATPQVHLIPLDKFANPLDFFTKQKIPSIHWDSYKYQAQHFFKDLSPQTICPGQMLPPLLEICWNCNWENILLFKTLDSFQAHSGFLKGSFGLMTYVALNVMFEPDPSALILLIEQLVTESAMRFASLARSEQDFIVRDLDSADVTGCAILMAISIKDFNRAPNLLSRYEMQKKRNTYGAFLARHPQMHKKDGYEQPAPPLDINDCTRKKLRDLVTTWLSSQCSDQDKQNYLAIFDEAIRKGW